MNTIARALIEQTLLLEHSEEPLDLHQIVKILEDLGATLQESTPEEVETLRRALEEMTVEEARSARPRKPVIEFYRTFLSNFGIRR